MKWPETSQINKVSRIKSFPIIPLGSVLAGRSVKGHYLWCTLQTLWWPSTSRRGVAVFTPHWERWGLSTTRMQSDQMGFCLSSSSAMSSLVWGVRFGLDSVTEFRSHNAALALKDVRVFVAQSLFGPVLLQIGQLFAVYRATPLPVQMGLKQTF